MRFKKSEDPKTTRLFVRVTETEKREIEAKAADCCMPVSAFILKAVRGRQTRTKHDLNLIYEFRELAMSLREIYQSEKPREAKELEPVMKALVEGIDRIAMESRLKL